MKSLVVWIRNLSGKFKNNVIGVIDILIF